MKPYFYEGCFSPDLRSHVLANAKEFQSTMRHSVEAFGGRLVRCHMTASSIDPIGFLDFPDDLAARAWNTFYASQKGVESSVISRLLDEQDLSDIQARVQKAGPAATAHRKS